MKSNVRIIFLILCLHDDFKCSLAFFLRFIQQFLVLASTQLSISNPISTDFLLLYYSGLYQLDLYCQISG